MTEDTPRNRMLRIIRRWRRKEERAERSIHGACWHSVAEIRRAVFPEGKRADNDHVRGLLIEQVAAGEVEVYVFANGVFWRSSRPLYLS